MTDTTEVKTVLGTEVDKKAGLNVIETNLEAKDLAAQFSKMITEAQGSDSVIAIGSTLGIPKWCQEVGADGEIYGLKMVSNPILIEREIKNGANAGKTLMVANAKFLATREIGTGTAKRKVDSVLTCQLNLDSLDRIAQTGKEGEFTATVTYRERVVTANDATEKTQIIWGLTV
jgi:hypothetical protein